jgi:hypothetical protein
MDKKGLNLFNEQCDEFDQYVYLMYDNSRVAGISGYAMYVLAKTIGVISPASRVKLKTEIIHIFDGLGSEMFEDDDDLGSKLIEMHEERVKGKL